MTKTGRFLPSPRRVVLLVPPDGQLIGMIGFMEALNAANRVRASRDRPPLYSLALVGVGAQTATAAGVVLQTGRADGQDGPHTLVVGGALESVTAPAPPAVRAQVARLATDATRVVAVCAGAFVLGELGMLDGRRCTTHWLALDALRERFPTALVQDDAIYTEDGRVLTSAGATAGIDLALHLVRQDGGPRLALAVARLLVVFAQRPGGQSQFGAALSLRPGIEDRLRKLISTVVQDPSGDHTVDALADRVAISPRHFARVFRDQTGDTPAAFVARVRVEAAQRALAHSDVGLDTVANDCGYGTVETLRRSFIRHTGVSPSAWRRRFRIA